MNKNFLCSFILVVLVTIVASKNHRLIELRSGTIDTTVEKQAHEVSWSEYFSKFLTGSILNSIPNANEDKTIRTYFVHFDHQLQSHDSSLEQLKKLGILLGHYVPKNSYIISGTIEQIQKAKRVTGVLWVGEMNKKHKSHQKQLLKGFLNKHTELSAKFEPTGARKLQTIQEKVEFLVFGQLAEHYSKEHLKENTKEWSTELKKLIGDNFISLVVATKNKIAIGVYESKSALQVTNWLKKQGLVHWVEIKPPTKGQNKYSAMLTQSYKIPYAKPLWNRNINGNGQIVGVGDTGLDTFHCFFWDENNPVPYQREWNDILNTSTHRKINGFWEYMDRIDSLNGHGTHVSGIASGDPHKTLTPDPVLEHQSVAFGAKLNFMDCGCDTDAGCKCPSRTQCECDTKQGQICQKKFGVVYLPLALDDGYFPWFYEKGAKVVSNSWGTGYYKDFSFGYSTSSQEIDSFAYEKGDFLPVFASGNSGGVFGYASLTSESESKNALIVGASMNMLESFQSNTNFTDFSNVVDHYRVELFQSYCSQGSLDYDAVLCEAAKNFNQAACCDDGGVCPNPPTSECCGVQKFKAVPGISFRCCPACINLEMAQQPNRYSPKNLAYFTARGPALDGRIKPDIVAVGDFILSSKSLGTTPSNTCNKNQKITDILTKKEGTSMASPLTAAAATLVRQFYAQGFYPSGIASTKDSFNPSASLVKATTIHSAELLDGYIYLLSKHIWWNLVYREGQRFQLTTPYLQGFGRIELNNVLAKDSGFYVPNTSDRQIVTGEQNSYCVSLSSGDKSLKATLVWTDPPSSPISRNHLVNDLDLIVVGPDGNIYYGNGKYSPIGTARDSPDFLNNVEQFVWKGAPLGRYNIIVRGNAVPKGPQSYSIVISGNISPTIGCQDFLTSISSADLNRYVTLSYGFGMLAIIAIPALALLALYFFLQYRSITTSSKGYKSIDSLRDSESNNPLFQKEDDEAPKEYQDFQNVESKLMGISEVTDKSEVNEEKSQLLQNNQ